MGTDAAHRRQVAQGSGQWLLNYRGVFNTVPMTLKPQLPRLETPEAIKSNLLVPAQQAVARLNSLISNSEAKINEIRALVSGGKAGGNEPMRARAASQPIQAITDIRKQVQSEGRDIVKALDAAAEMAQEMAERHWSIRVMLRLAKPGGIAQAATLRAQYAQVLAKAGTVELAGWAQNAIDTGDVVLMDAVVRENDSRKRDDRAFLTPGVLELFGNVYQEYRLGQAMLNEVVTTAKRGGMILAEFEKGTGAVSLNKIAMGLRTANADYTIDEAGGIVLAAHPDHNSQLDAVGQAMRKMAKK